MYAPTAAAKSNRRGWKPFPGFSIALHVNKRGNITEGWRRQGITLCSTLNQLQSHCAGTSNPAPVEAFVCVLHRLGYVPQRLDAVPFECFSALPVTRTQYSANLARVPLLG